MERYLKDHPTAFDPETVTILSAALDDAWKAVETNKSAYQIDGHADGARNELRSTSLIWPSRASGSRSA